MFVAAFLVFFAVGIVKSYKTTRFSITKYKNSLYSRPSFLKSTEESKTLWNEQIQYVDLNGNSNDPTPTSRTMPLFLLGACFYPSGKTALTVFEMKYRSMRFLFCFLI